MPTMSNIIRRIAAAYSVSPFKTLLVGDLEYSEMMALSKSNTIDIPDEVASIDIDRVDVSSAFQPLDYRESWDEMRALMLTFGNAIDRHVAPWYRKRPLYETMKGVGVLR